MADGADARDDDGVLLSEDQRYAKLEVAHILPHSLTNAPGGQPWVRFPVIIRCREHPWLLTRILSEPLETSRPLHPKHVR